jgi:hypothetical protein
MSRAGRRSIRLTVTAPLLRGDRPINSFRIPTLLIAKLLFDRVDTQPSAAFALRKTERHRQASTSKAAEIVRAGRRGRC